MCTVLSYFVWHYLNGLDCIASVTLDVCLEHVWTCSKKTELIKPQTDLIKQNKTFCWTYDSFKVYMFVKSYLWVTTICSLTHCKPKDKGETKSLTMNTTGQSVSIDDEISARPPSVFTGGTTVTVMSQKKKMQWGDERGRENGGHAMLLECQWTSWHVCISLNQSLSFWMVVSPGCSNRVPLQNSLRSQMGTATQWIVICA